MIAGILVPLGFVIATSMLSPSVSRSAARSAPLPQVLALSAEQSGRLLTLRWNGNAPVLQSAARAILHIEDGDYQHDRHLDLRELRGGRLTYEARTPEVIFQLEIYGQQPSAIGYTHVTNLARAIPSPPPETVQQERQDKKQEPIPIPTAPQTAATRPAPPLVNDPPSSIAVAPPQVRELSAAVDRKQIDPVLLADAPKPPSQPVPSPNPDLTSRSLERPASIDVSTEPVTPSLLGRVVEKVPLLRRARKQVTAPPVPVYEAKPSLDSEGTQKIEEPVSIAVKVSVAETGAVREAQVVDYGEPPNWGAANAALEAARRWTFEPARAEDAVVPGEIVLRFRFNP